MEMGCDSDKWFVFNWYIRTWTSKRISKTCFYSCLKVESDGVVISTVTKRGVKAERTYTMRSVDITDRKCNRRIAWCSSRKVNRFLIKLTSTKKDISSVMRLIPCKRIYKRIWKTSDNPPKTPVIVVITTVAFIRRSLSNVHDNGAHTL